MYVVDASLIFFGGVFSNSVQNNNFVHHILCGGTMYPVEQKPQVFLVVGQQC